MIYFDNAATGGKKPDCVLNVVSAALKTCANPGRSGHRLSLAHMERVYEARKYLCGFFGGYSYDRVIFTPNCTAALNAVLFGTLKEGDKAVTTVAEHNSVLRPLERLKKSGVVVEYAPLDDKKRIDICALSRLVAEDTRAVIVTLASNVTGAVTDIGAVRRAIGPRPLLIADGAQACGHIPVDMKKSGIDALCVAGHKGMYGVQGSGALIFSDRVNPSPLLFGGTGSDSLNLGMPDFYPDALEAGTLNYPAICSLAEGARYISENFSAESEKLSFACSFLHGELSSVKGVRLFSEPNPVGIVAFSVYGAPSEDVALALSEDYNICVRAGLHCAPLMHAALGSEGLVRASLSPFNSISECEKFVSAVRAISRS